MLNVLVRQHILSAVSVPGIQRTAGLLSIPGVFNLSTESRADLGPRQQVNAINYVAEEGSSSSQDPEDWIGEQWSDLLIGTKLSNGMITVLPGYCVSESGKNVVYLVGFGSGCTYLGSL